MAAKKVIRDERLKLDIVIEGNNAQKALGDLEQESRELKEQITDLTREINKTKDKDSAATKEMIRNRKDLAKEIDNSVDKESQATQEKIAKLKELDREISKSKTKDAEATKEMIASRKELNKSLSENREKQALIRNELGLHGMTYRQLGQVAKGLQAQLSNSTYGSEQWKKLDAELKTVKARMTEVRGGAQQAGFSLSKMAQGFNKYFMMVSTFALSITGLVTGVRKAYLKFAEFDDKIADVMKTTGLTKDQVKELNKEFDKIDTRSSQEELMDLARIAGKLGINASEDVLGFVRAADKINVALSEDLGGNAEDAIRELGKLTDIFKLKDTYGMEESLLKIGSTINALGAASTANEPYLVEFTKRLAGVAPSVNMSIQNVLGLAATLDQLGQTSEVSSTVMSQLLPKMFKDMGTFANIAGMELKEFSDLLNTDTNEAMIRVLEGLNGNNEGFEKLVHTLGDMGMEGKRTISVLGVLANNTATLRQQQQFANVEFDKGTSILEEFNTKNENARAGLDKAVKVIQRTWRELGEKLAPAIRGVISSGTALVRSLTVVVDFFIRYGNVLKVVGITLGTYIATTKVYALVVLAAAKAKALWASITVLFSSRMSLATRAMQIFNTVSKANIIGAIVGLFMGLIAVLSMLKPKFDSLTSAQKALNDVSNEATKRLVEEQSAMKTLLAIARDEKRSKEEREEAIRRLNEISPMYLGNLTLEKINTDEAKAATDRYIDSLHRKYKVQAAEEKIVELHKKVLDLEIGKDEASVSWWQKAWNMVKSMGNVGVANVLNLQNEAKKLGVVYQDLTTQILTLEEYVAQEKEVPISIKTKIAAEDTDPTSAPRVLTEDELKEQKKAHEAKMKELQKQAEDIKKAYETLYDEVAFVELTEYDRSIALLEKKFQEQQQIIEKARTTKIKGADGKESPVISETEARRSLELIEIQYLEKRMEIDQQEYQRLITTTTQKVQKEEEYQAQIRRVREQYVERNSELITYELTLLEEQHRKGIVSTEQYTQRLAELNVERTNISLQFDKQVAQEQLKHITALHTQKLMATSEYTTQSEQLNRRIEEIQISLLSEASRKELEVLNEKHINNLISESEFINQKRTILETSNTVQVSLEESLNRQLQAIRRTNSDEGMAVLKTELTSLYTLYTEKKNQMLMSDEEYTRRSNEITTNTQKLTNEQVTEQLKTLNDERETRAQKALVIEEEYRQKKQEIINKAVQDDHEVKAEKERLEKLAALRKQYGLQTNAELLQEELEQLLDHYKKMGMADADYAKSRAEILKKYSFEYKNPDKDDSKGPGKDDFKGTKALPNLDKWKDEETAKLTSMYEEGVFTFEEYELKKDELTRMHTEIRNDIIREGTLATIQMFGSMFGELAGMFEEGSQEYKLFASFQVGLDTIVASVGAFNAIMSGTTAKLLGPAALPVAIAFAATTAAFGIKKIAEINSMQVPQYYTGYYDVVGERDGKQYQAKYQGKPKTGYVSTPSLYLAGDDPHRLKEMIVSGPDLQNPMIADYARAIMDIKANRQPVFNMPADVQFNRSAAGQPTQGSGGASQQAGAGNTEMVALLQSINNKLDNPTRAYMVYSELERAKQKIENIQNDVRRS
jgi:TP901 family phage tail tape measure protein